MKNSNYVKSSSDNERLRRIRQNASQNATKAYADILKYIAEYKNDMDAYYLYGQISEKIGKLDEAKTAYELVTSKPRGLNKYNAAVKLGLIAKKEGNMQLAKEYLIFAIENSPKEEKSAQMTLATIYRIEGNYPQALNVLSEISVVTNDVLEEKALVLSQMGRPEEALATLKRIKKEASIVYNRHIACEKAKLAIAMRDYVQAEIFISEAKTCELRDFIYCQATYLEALMALSKGEYAKAQGYCESLLADKNSIFGNVNIVLGKIHEANSNFKKALEQYQIALNTSSDKSVVAKANFNIGSLKFSLGELEEAIPYLKNSISNDQALNKNKTIKLISIYLRLGEYDKADQLAREFTKKAPNEASSAGLDCVEILIAQRTGKQLPPIPANTYLLKQVIDYDKTMALNHIKQNHQRAACTTSNFSRKIDLNSLFEEIKLSMSEENSVYEDIFDIYDIDYPNAGYNLENELVHQIRVITIPGTKNIITMYPSSKKSIRRRSNTNYQASEQKVNSKRIDRFNARFAKFQNKVEQ